MTSISNINRGFYTEANLKILEAQTLPKVLCQLVTEYLFTDIQKIYKKTVESLALVPKSEAEPFLLKIKEQWEKAGYALALENDNPSFRYQEAPGGSTHRINKLFPKKNIQVLSSVNIVNSYSKYDIAVGDLDVFNHKYNMPLAGISSGVNQCLLAECFTEPFKFLYEKELSLKEIGNQLSVPVENAEIYAVELINWIWIVNFGTSKAFVKMGDTMIALTTPSSRERGTVTAIPRACLQKGDYVLFGSSAIFKGASTFQLFDAMETHPEAPLYNLINNLVHSCAQAANSEDVYALTLFRITK